MSCIRNICIDRQIDRRIDTQTDRQTNREKDRQTDRQTDKQTNRHIIYSHTDSTCKYARIFLNTNQSLQTTKSLTNGLNFECQNQIIYLNYLN